MKNWIEEVLRVVRRELPYTAVGRITEVDQAKGLCSVLPSGSEAEIFNVSLPTGVTPAIDSLVKVAWLSKERAYLTSFSTLDGYDIRVEKAGMTLEGGKVKLDNQQESLKALLEDIGQAMSDLAQAVSILTVPTPAGPSSPPANAADFVNLKTTATQLKQRVANLLD